MIRPPRVLPEESFASRVDDAVFPTHFKAGASAIPGPDSFGHLGLGVVELVTILGLETVVLLARVADPQILKFEVRLKRRVGHGHDVLVADLTEPASSVTAQDMSGVGCL